MEIGFFLIMLMKDLFGMFHPCALVLSSCMSKNYGRPRELLISLYQTRPSNWWSSIHQASKPYGNPLSIEKRLFQHWKPLKM